MRVENICPDPRNSRRLEITPENDPKLQELADSIKQFGDVIEPLVVRLRSEEDINGDYHNGCHYMLVSGHRRLAAAKLVGLETIHCSVWENLSDAQAFEMQLVENLHRSDLTPIEEADAYKRMSEELGYTYAEIALRVGKSEKHIGRYMKLLTLPEEILHRIDTGDLTLGKALVLCSLSEKILNEILGARYSYLLTNNFNLKEFKENILRAFILKLSDKEIHFNLKEKYTEADGTEWPACNKCPHKKQMNLFEEFDKDEQCPYAPCFRAKQGLAESPEDDGDENDNEDETETETEKEARLKEEMEKKIRVAVEKAKVKWYVEKKIEIGFSPQDILFGDNNSLIDGYSYQYLDELYTQYIGKTADELKQNGTYEEIVKAMVIYDICNNVDYNEDEVAEQLSCEQCPDDVLQAARDEAMGINKGKARKK
ncbi:MAG: ParB/RepB/Spo0J family partition protein [Fibromonadaceae bacterium]|jgi:ParB/RepB/Spo0J family partition protein|nr:ParB/RepB/Spo0J family partition protein [Fibromonadaceae bacterium]